MEHLLLRAVILLHLMRPAVYNDTPNCGKIAGPPGGMA